MKLDDDDFTLFGLPQRFGLDRAQIDERWRALQSEVHPDRFAAQGAAAQRVAMQWAVRVNEAYGRLKDPLARGAYLCELRGFPIEADSNTAMPGEFLMQQMAWREALDDASGEAEVQAIDDEVVLHERSLQSKLATLLDDQRDDAAAAATVRELMFVNRFRSDIDRRMEALESH
jgi:molecular chaperone HscB